MRFRYPATGAVFDLPLSEPQEQFAKGEGFDDTNTAASVVVDADGITLRLVIGRRVRFEPETWREYWGKRQPTEGVEACAAWQQWCNHVLDHSAQYVLAEIAADRMTFYDARETFPEVFDHPDVQRALARAFVDDAIGKRQPGKRKTVTEDHWRLYAWASWYYRSEAERSWEAACDRACDEHPELVPKSWTRDPGGNLKRFASRNLDPHPKRNQPRDR